MAVKTISKNGKRVPADQKGRAPKKPAKFQTSSAKIKERAAAGFKKNPATKPEKTGAATKPEPPPAVFTAPHKPVLKKPKGDLAAFPAKICALLGQVRVQRSNAQNEERSMVKHRKSLDQWFTKNGDPGETCATKHPTDEESRLHAERLDLYRRQSAEYKRVVDAIKLSRTAQHWLAEKADSLIDMGMEGRISDDMLDDAIDELIKQAPDLPLFSITEHEDKGKAKPGSEHIDKHDGTTVSMDDGDGLPADPEDDDTQYQYVNQPVEHLITLEKHGAPVVSDAAVACLKRAEIEYIRQISNLDSVPGLSAADVKGIDTAIGMLMKAEKQQAAAAA
jgi:hypothetical protein